MTNKNVMSWAEFISTPTATTTAAPTIKFVADAAPTAPRLRRDAERAIRRALVTAAERRAAATNSATEGLFEAAEKVPVSIQDALDAGCCRQGTARWLKENRKQLHTRHGVTTAERLLNVTLASDSRGRLVAKGNRILEIIEVACRHAGATGEKVMALLPSVINQCGDFRDPSTGITVPVLDADREATVKKLTKLASLVLAPRWSSDWAAAAVRKISQTRGHVFYPGCCRDSVRALVDCHIEWITDEWSGYYWEDTGSKAVYVSGSGRTMATVDNDGIEIRRSVGDKDDEIRIQISAGAPMNLVGAALYGTAGQGMRDSYFTAGVPADLSELAQRANVAAEEAARWVSFAYDVEIPDGEDEIGGIEAIGPRRPSRLRLRKSKARTC